MRLASMANSSNNPNIARQAYDTSQFAVNRANNVATGSLPNTYTPYDSNGNPYSYFNSSRQAGKTPSPDAPRVEDVSGDAAYYCDVEKEKGTIVVVTDRETLHKYNLYMGTAVFLDIVQIVGAAKLAIGATAAIPISAGVSAIIAFASMEGMSMSVVQLINDIITMIKANSDYRAGKKFKLGITQDPIEFMVLGIFSTEEIE